MAVLKVRRGNKTTHEQVPHSNVANAGLHKQISPRICHSSAEDAFCEARIGVNLLREERKTTKRINQTRHFASTAR
jgi:hypothetical protein